MSCLKIAELFQLEKTFKIISPTITQLPSLLLNHVPQNKPNK